METVKLDSPCLERHRRVYREIIQIWEKEVQVDNSESIARFYICLG